jgi:hypothetical protein
VFFFVGCSGVCQAYIEGTDKQTGTRIPADTELTESNHVNFGVWFTYKKTISTERWCVDFGCDTFWAGYREIFERNHSRVCCV